MTEYATETGYYVLCDSDGRVIAKASVPVGTHPVDDRTDVSQSYDMDSEEDLNSVDINPHYNQE